MEVTNDDSDPYMMTIKMLEHRIKSLNVEHEQVIERNRARAARARENADIPDEGGNDENADKKIRADLEKLTKETELLKKSVPEGKKNDIQFI